MCSICIYGTEFHGPNKLIAKKNKKIIKSNFFLLILRFHVWRLVTSAPFENLILFLIILNTISLMMKFHQAPLFFVDILSYCNLLFTSLFTIEFGLKVFSFGPKVKR